LDELKLPESLEQDAFGGLLGEITISEIVFRSSMVRARRRLALSPVEIRSLSFSLSRVLFEALTTLSVED
jgi:hypothetical protein